MFSGDQYKGFTDHGKETPIPEPSFWPLYVAALVVLLVVVLFALFG